MKPAILVTGATGKTGSVLVEELRGRRYRPTSAEMVGMDDIAASVGRAVGRTLKVRDVPAEAFLKVARAAGVPDFEITSVRHYIADGKRGVFAVQGVTAGQGQLTGQPPETMDAIAREAAAAPEARRSFSDRIRELGGMLRIVTARPLDADAYERAQEHPQPRRPTLAGDSATWAREHAHQPGPGEAAAA